MSTISPALTSSTDASATSPTTSARITRWLLEAPRVCWRSVSLTSARASFSAGSRPASTPAAAVIAAAKNAARMSTVVSVSPS